MVVKCSFTVKCCVVKCCVVKCCVVVGCNVTDADSDYESIVATPCAQPLTRALSPSQ